MPKRKPKNKTWYKKKSDIIFSKIVRSVGCCQRCGSSNYLQCAHIEPRTNLTLRWSEQNALCLCMKCHIYWAHKNPREFTHWVESEFPDKIKYIDSNKNKITKYTLDDYEQLHSTLKEQYNEIKKDI